MKMITQNQYLIIVQFFNYYYRKKQIMIIKEKIKVVINLKSFLKIL